MEGNILFHSYNCTGEPSARPYSERLDWDLAKRVYQFTSQEFTSALTCGTLEDAIASAPSIWKVPVYYGDSDYAYANVGTSGNSPGYTTVYGNADTGNDAPYLFEPEACLETIRKKAKLRVHNFFIIAILYPSQSLNRTSPVRSLESIHPLDVFPC